jgi:hypothetical protein
MQYVVSGAFCAKLLNVKNNTLAPSTENSESQQKRGATEPAFPAQLNIL